MALTAYAQLTELCRRTHTRYVTGKCPWCGEQLDQYDPVARAVLEIVAYEDKSTPLRDEEIAAQLEAQGLTIGMVALWKRMTRLGIPEAKSRRKPIV